jgi:hypothetical protein
MVSAVDKKKCQSIYQNLFECRQEKDIPASAYIRELFETSRCDSDVDFKPFREEYSVRLNKGDAKRLLRVLEFEETEVDEKIAAQACMHYVKWHNEQLVSALSWPNWFVYHTFDRAERTLAVFGIAGGGYAGFKVARASWRLIRNRFNK